ncbi:MAG TPA: hypothetical protein VM243_08600 [Phycisphaerae bacterium]|nr:hypothetical protein [Phycisphaerae bacterium]
MSRSPVVATIVVVCGCLLLVAARPVVADCPCSETVAAYPYLEDFEGGMGSWQNVEGDDFDWDRNQGGTPSDNTGPDVDHTLGTDQGYYMYTESSGDNSPDKTAILVGPCFDLSTLSAPQMSFWYHMAGDSMGWLYLEVSVDDCATWNVAFEMDGHQGYDWNLAVLNLSDYAGQTLAVRLRGVTSYGYESDMAVDDIYVGEAVSYDGGCCDLDTGNCLGLMTEADCQAYGNVAWYLVSDCTEDNFCPQPPPANDLCEGAVVIDSLPFFDGAVDYKWATPDLPVSCDDDACDDSGYGVWYTYTPTEDCGARVRIEPSGGGAASFLTAFTGNDCGDLAEVFCSSEQADWNLQEFTFNMDAGTTYWLLIGSFWCDSQPYPTIDITFNCSLGACCLGETCSLETAADCDAAGSYYFGDGTSCAPDACLYGACCTSIGCESLTSADCAAAAGDFLGNGVPCYLDTCPPVNETCATALPVTDGAPAAEGDTTLASYDDDTEASCEEWTDKDLWYAYTATCTGAVAVDTEGSGLWDTILSVWDECGGEEIACATDGPSGSLAALEFDAIAGETHYIRFASYWGANGTFQINISCTEAPQGACCFGDTCTIDYRLTCEAADGAYGGDDTSCPGADCNGSGVEDICDILNDYSGDCNENHVPDECDIYQGTSLDRDGNGVPDECDPDCNENGIIDGCDVSCDGDCPDFEDCGQSDDCQDDGIPDECQLEIEGCDGVRVDQGDGDLVDGVRPDWGWANYGIADDFTLEQDETGSCFRFDIYDFVDSGNLPVMQVRIYENYDGLMNLEPFWQATPVFEQTYSLEDGTLEIFDTGQNLAYYDLLRFVASGTDWSLSEGDYAMHLTFPETGGAGFWATAGSDDSDCSVYWGDWWGWPSETCDGGADLSRLSFALLGSANNDCNENGVPDECDLDCNDNGIPDDCEEDVVACPQTLIIKQGACPAPVNPNGHGVVKMVLVGGEGVAGSELDVHDVVLESVKLRVCDDPDGNYAVPSPGSPSGFRFKDLTSPYLEPVECDGCACAPDHSSDGIDDLEMKFRTDDLVDAGLLDGSMGALITFELTADLVDGRQIYARDCIRLVQPGASPGQLAVSSNVVGTWVQLVPPDDTLDDDGFCNFLRSYPEGSVVTLTADAFYDGLAFRAWRVDGISRRRGQTTLQLTLDQDVTVQAMYMRIETQGSNRPGQSGSLPDPINDGSQEPMGGDL